MRTPSPEPEDLRDLVAGESEQASPSLGAAALLAPRPPPCLRPPEARARAGGRGWPRRICAQTPGWVPQPPSPKGPVTWGPGWGPGERMGRLAKNGLALPGTWRGRRSPLKRLANADSVRPALKSHRIVPDEEAAADARQIGLVFGPAGGRLRAEVAWVVSL